MKRFLATVFIVVSFVFCFAARSVRAEEVSGTTEITAPSEAADITALSETADITVPFASAGGKILSWDFPYSDSLFLKPSAVFSEDLTKASMGLMISAFYGADEGLEPQYETYLGGAGFQDIYAFGYGEETSKDTLAGVIGWKQVGDFILIAASPRGSGYEKEWAGNLEVGAEERHVGFSNGAQILERELLSYIERLGLSGPKKLWLSGFSRAAAVSNLTAADMKDSGLFEDVFAYLFGVPRTTQAADHAEYTGIYNICGKDDPVPQVPMESWGYNRYGQDLYTPSVETDSRYFNMAILAEYVSSDLTGDQFIYSPDISYYLHMILEFLNEMFPTNQDYVDKFQDTLMSMWTEEDPDHILEILMEAAANLRGLDQREESSAHILIDYLSMLIGEFTSEDSALYTGGQWNPRQGIGENMLREHMPYTYVTWVFSGIPEEDLYHGANLSRRLSLYGDIDVEVWRDGVFLSGRDAEGEEIYKEGDGVNYFDILDSPENYDYYIQKVYIIRHGNETVLNLPADGSYDVLVRTHGVNALVYYDVFCTPDKTFGIPGKMHTQTVSEGEYHLYVDAAEDLPGLRTETGGITSAVRTAVDYSPTFVMANESGRSRFATMDDVIGLALFAILAIVLTLLVCLVIFIVHSVKVKRGKGPFSSWFVIIPHLILIALFIILNSYVTYYLFSIDSVRKILALLAFAFIILLAVRGLIRRKTGWNAVILTGLVGAAAIDFFFYQRSHLVTSSVAALIIYACCLALFAALAAWSFFLKKRA